MKNFVSFCCIVVIQTISFVFIEIIAFSSFVITQGTFSWNQRLNISTTFRSHLNFGWWGISLLLFIVFDVCVCMKWLELQFVTNDEASEVKELTGSNNFFLFKFISHSITLCICAAMVFFMGKTCPNFYAN